MRAVAFLRLAGYFFKCGQNQNHTYNKLGCWGSGPAGNKFTMSTRILIADDDSSQLRCLEASILRMGHRTILADSGIGALSAIQSRKDIGLIVLDVAMHDLDGYTLLKRIAQARIDTPVIALVPNDDMNMAMCAIKLGAVDFVTKPVACERLQISVANALKLDALANELRRQRRSIKSQMQLCDMVTKSPEMEKVIRLARRIAALDAPFLIEGEPGTGKKTLARAICYNETAGPESFLTLDCRTLTLENLKAALCSGSDTASLCEDSPLSEKLADTVCAGHGGVFYFDEISFLSVSIQRKLFELVHSNQVENIRIIASSSRSLLGLVHMGRFHAGLYYWLSSFSIKMPPLRDRIEDIPYLAHRFLLCFSSEERRGHIRGISPFALEQLKKYYWPDNVRELKNALYQAVLMCENTELTVRDFRFTGIRTNISSGNLETTDIGFDLSLPNAPAYARGGTISGVDYNGQVRSLAQIEEDAIRLAIDHYEGQLSEVARRLGIGRTTLYRKLKEYGIDVANMSGRCKRETEEAPGCKSE
ncbi:DNA-binding NtrC family response regulator [Falsochrobactrum ovis]|uniref:DNA-binding transcriptional regulator NtrC n=2 Tax=Falsochrobactrum ovis TaxID=1293442 RepID=A0A364JSJ8_9HYPH|nr:DNA-binding NtrC family response regulator [Falsochrobactrum ovis]